jgi:DNA-binding Xre family transcriptional regulator
MFKSPAEKISTYLSEHGIKQRFLARKINMNENILSSRLRGVSKFSYDEIALICGVLNLQPNDIIEPRLPNGNERDSQ